MRAAARLPDDAMSLRAQFLRFAAAGAAGTALHYAVLATLVYLAGMQPGWSAAIGAAAGAAVNYSVNRAVTFRSDRAHGEALPRFAAMAAAGMLLNGVLVEAMAGAGLHVMLAQAVATAFILVLNYIVSRTWIFTKNSK